MGAGHAGSSPYGIALAAWRRGFHAEIWVSHKGAVLLDYQNERRLAQGRQADAGRR